MKQYELIVKDDGIGMDEDIIPGKRETLGLILINAIADQLHGELLRTNDGGTGYLLRFSDAEKARTKDRNTGN